MAFGERIWTGTDLTVGLNGDFFCSYVMVPSSVQQGDLHCAEDNGLQGTTVTSLFICKLI